MMQHQEGADLHLLMKRNMELLIVAIMDHIVVTTDQDDLQFGELFAPQCKPIPIGIDIAMK